MIVLVGVGLAMAQVPQTTNLTTDILGAHLVYGRGCVACHAPHSGARGNGVTPKVNDPTLGNWALWGQDVTPLYNQQLQFGDNGWTKYTVTLPADMSKGPFDAITGIMLCLSCHDGNLASPGMMKTQTVETLPVVGGKAPTLLGNDGTTKGNYLNDHPVGPKALVTCNGFDPANHNYDWDCTLDGAGGFDMTGTGSANFVNNYGHTIETFNNGAGGAMVTCISCHDQHSQNIFWGTMNGQATPGPYYTQFFVRGYYNPGNGGNSAAQFCRNCHGGESNEMHGQLNVPTT